MLRNFLIVFFFFASVPQFHLRDTQGATLNNVVIQGQ